MWTIAVEDIAKKVFAFALWSQEICYAFWSADTRFIDSTPKGRDDGSQEEEQE